MARARSPKNLIEKIQDGAEEAMAKVADAPVVGRVVEGASGMKDRLDDLTTRMRGLEDIQRRVEQLEKKVEQLSKAQKPAPARPSAAKAAAGKAPRAAAAKPAPPKKAPVKKPGAVAGP